jgi:cytochrome c5
MRAAFVTLALACLVLAGCTSSGGTSQAPADPPPASSAAQADPSASTPAALVRERCTRCHTIDRIKAAKHDQAGWENTISRMRHRGARLTDPEASDVIDFLANGGGGQL